MRFSTLSVLLLAGLFACTPKLHTARWTALYTPLADTAPLDLDLLITDAGDNPQAAPLRVHAKTIVAYVSLGEVDLSRNDLLDAHKAATIVQPSTYWPGSLEVDFRAQAWRHYLLEKHIPDLLSRGYDGIFFDTVNTMCEQTRREPKKFSGSLEALVGFLKDVRHQHPKSVLVLNDGLCIAEEVKETVDAFLIESIYTKRDWHTGALLSKAHREARRERLSALKAVAAQAGKRVLLLEYFGPKNASARHAVCTKEPDLDVYFGPHHLNRYWDFECPP